MKSIIFLSALIPVISAHTRFTTLFVNGQSQGDGTCIRMDMSPLTTTVFVSSIDSADMACGKDGDTSVDRTCPLKPGDSISLVHRVWPDGTNPGSIDPRHKGSTAVYMKKLADAGSTDPYSTSASGDGWFKIAWNGYDNDQWGTDKMIANDGKVDAAIPGDLSGGYYLIRSEILALQNVTNDKTAPQFYAGCAQVYVDTSKSGDATAQTVSIPGYVDDSTSALNYNIYQSTPPAVPYVEFGPSVYGSVSARAVGDLAARSRRFRVGSYWRPKYTWNNVVDESTSSDSGSGSGSGDSVGDTETSTTTGSTAVVTSTVATSTAASTPAFSSSSSVVGSSSPDTSSSKSAPTAQSTAGSSSSLGSNLSIVGTCPSDTVLTVANSCLTEIPSWSGDTSGALPKCWAASKQCWDVSSNCWKTISPAVNVNDMNAGCHAWENKCNALDDWCRAGNLEGPPAWNGGNVKKGKRDVARHLVAAKRQGWRR